MTYENVTRRIASKLCKDECLRGRLIKARQDHCYENFDELLDTLKELELAERRIDVATEGSASVEHKLNRVAQRIIDKVLILERLPALIAKCEHIDFT